MKQEGVREEIKEREKKENREGRSKPIAPRPQTSRFGDQESSQPWSDPLG